MNVTAANLRDVISSVGRGKGRARGWFTRIVSSYLHYRDAHRAVAPAEGIGTEADRALRIIKISCIKSAVGGVASGLVTTGATLFAAEIPGTTSLFIAVPAAIAGVAAEMVARTLINLDMTCDLAEIFGVRLDPADPTDVWQLYSLAFETHAEASDDQLVKEVEKVDAHKIGETIGHQLVGESVLKNIVPFLGVAISAVTNWRSTRALGDTVRRYMRYRRALDGALAEAESVCRDHMDLLVEGLWFLFVSDGSLSPEETAVIARLMRRMEPAAREAVQTRFTDDEADWLTRLPILDAGERAPFLHALEVAAAVDKIVSLPEQKILGRAAKRLGLDLDMERVDRMVREFETVGVLR